MKKILMTLAVACLLLANICSAVPLNKPLPTLTIQDKGEMLLKDDEISYHPWSSAALTGKMRVVQYMAGRLSVKKINNPFMDALKAAELDHAKYQTTTIVNVDDALFGTTPFVIKEVTYNQKKYPYASFVIDANGNGQKVWNLGLKNSAIMVLNQKGKVLFFKQGALTPEEIKQNIALIKSNLGN